MSESLLSWKQLLKKKEEKKKPFLVRLESWQPSRHSIGCLTARLVTELTCLDASREVGAERASARELLSTAETGTEKLQRGSEVAPALIPHKELTIPA